MQNTSLGTSVWLCWVVLCVCVRAGDFAHNEAWEQKREEGGRGQWLGCWLHTQPFSLSLCTQAVPARKSSSPAMNLH